MQKGRGALDVLLFFALLFLLAYFFIGSRSVTPPHPVTHEEPSPK